ncbi:MAG: ACP S-malonyltransferase [Caldilineaceae bacterium]|nr:ACP S-malonyltransferase [Caldilineaceae bacterium]
MFPLLQTFTNSALLFPGQGSQEVGMGQELCQTYPTAKAIFDQADDLLGFSLSRLCFEGPEDELTDTINVQPAILTMSTALLAALQVEFASPAQTIDAETANTFVAGHSLGEYSALVAAGSLSFTDALRLVRERGRLMKEAGEANPGMMAAVLGLDEATVATICAEATASAGVTVVANDNCPGQTVISGERAGVEKAMEALQAAGARKLVPLAVSIASHSPLMQPAAAQLRAAIDAAPISAPVVPLIGNTTAQPLIATNAIRDELAAQLTGSVRWTASMQFLVKAGVTDFIEIGPGDVLTSLMKRIERSANRRAINDVATLQAFSQA